MKNNKRKIILATFAFLLLTQIVVFRAYLSPFLWGEIKVDGLACTCPDEKVISGNLYLRTVTPDSLKKYNLDYSEIYVTERPYTQHDVMGIDGYIISGRVIGKKRVSEFDPWNPLVRVDKWREVDILNNLVIKTFFSLQVFIFLILVWRWKNVFSNRP